MRKQQKIVYLDKIIICDGIGYRDRHGLYSKFPSSRYFVSGKFYYLVRNVSILHFSWLHFWVNFQVKKLRYPSTVWPLSLTERPYAARERKKNIKVDYYHSRTAVSTLLSFFSFSTGHCSAQDWTELSSENSMKAAFFHFVRKMMSGFFFLLFLFK